MSEETGAGSDWEDDEEPLIPDDDPADHETGKRFMVGWRRLMERYVQLRVTLDKGDVEAGYAPAELVVDVSAAITKLLKDVGGEFPPMLFGVVPDGSMSLYFGDPAPDGGQERLALGITESNAARVAEALSCDSEEEVFGQALRLGAGATSYRDLAQLVHVNGIDLRWQVRDHPTVELTSDRAALHYRRLAKPPPVRERPTTVNGRLYRVIDEPRGDHLGSLGIHLFRWSDPPPLWGQTVFPVYESPEILDTIKQDSLIGESVETTLVIRQPVPGTTLEPTSRPELVVASIGAGPSEDSRLGESLDASDDDGPDS